jgi:hypothetical protein
MRYSLSTRLPVIWVLLSREKITFSPENTTVMPLFVAAVIDIRLAGRIGTCPAVGSKLPQINLFVGSTKTTFA